MKRIVVITPPDALFGFTMAGVSQTVTSSDEAEAAVRRHIEDPECGVVIVDERLLSGIDEAHLQEMEKRWFGVLVVLPAPEKGAVEEDYAERLIRRVIGYHVRLAP